MTVRGFLRGFCAFRTGALALHAGFACAVLALALKAVAPGPKGDVSLVRGEYAPLGDEYLVLKRFTIDHWPSGRVRQYTSDVHLVKAGAGGMAAPANAAISVNHPLRRNGWWVYQSSYDPNEEGRTVLTAFKDPYLPLAAVAGVLLLLGGLVTAYRSCVRKGVAYRTSDAGKTLRWNALRIALAVALSCVPVYFIGKSCFKTDLMPALQSPLLFPHILAYLAGYVLLLFAAVGYGRRWVGAGFGLVTLGLVLGALWGKICWGDFWQYDPKEMWSLATWLVYAAYFHVRGRGRPRLERALLFFGGVMIILTLTWVNLSRLWTGMHSYA